MTSKFPGMRPVLFIISFLFWAAAASAEPNIVILIADDMGWGDVGYNGSEIRTPEIDRLATEGLRLNHFYAQAVCSPTRSSLLTGRTTLNTGAMAPFNPWYQKGLPVDEKLLPEYLRENGYRTHAVGKWHLGPNLPQYHPLQRGFDTYYGNLNGYLDHVAHTVFGRVDWQRDGKTVYDEGHTTDLIAGEAVRIIEERDGDAPIFLYVSFAAPHTPLQASDETIASYSEITNENRRVYAAMVTEMDRAIARITTALADHGMLDNTLLMFFSDNGGPVRTGASNRPLRGGKGSPWQGGIRVPASLSWPGKLEGGAVFDQRMTVMDILPTFLAAAGVSVDAPKPIDGQNLWPALADGKSIPSQDILLSNLNLQDVMQHSYFSGRWKLVRVGATGGESTDHLFDVREDPYEEHDLADKYPAVFDRLVAELDAMPGVEPLMLGEPTPDRRAPGSPGATEPDRRPAIGMPYAEAGPIPYPPRNYPEEAAR